MKKVLWLYFLLPVLGFAESGCIPLTTQEIFNRVDLVFTGKVTAINTIGRPHNNFDDVVSTKK